VWAGKIGKWNAGERGGGGGSARGIWGSGRASCFDSFRTSMEKGADQVNLNRAPLCGKTHMAPLYNNKTRTPLSLSLSLSLFSLRTGRSAEPSAQVIIYVYTVVNPVPF
jgi:hypothetical protein